MDDLAIIIPAYKAEHFDKTLNSLADQTNKNFKIYVGDDCSPNNLKEIVNKYKNILNIKYHRFEDNVGSKNLVNQWQRCIQLSNNEKWIWLFSDDDIAQNNCVENFYSTVKDKDNKFDVYRFNTCIINRDDSIINYCPVGPNEESSLEMAYNLLLLKRGNSMPDHIFSRDVYNKYNGFVYTDYAQGADWATSILFSTEKGICIIPNSILFWRYSGNNISSTAHKNRNQTIKGHLQFLEWTIKHFDYLKLEKSKYSINYEMILNALLFNFQNVIIYHYKGFNIGYSMKLINFLNSVLLLPYYKALKVLFLIKRRTSPKYIILSEKIKHYFD